jgi:hypothetical protein
VLFAQLYRQEQTIIGNKGIKYAERSEKIPDIQNISTKSLKQLKNLNLAFA